MSGRGKSTYSHRQREKALKEQRDAKLRRREERKVLKAERPKADDLAGIVPGPQPIDWADQGLPPLPSENDEA